VVSRFIPMAHLGFIIVPNGYTHEKIRQGHGTPYGSSSTSGQHSAKPTADELVVAKHQGTRHARGRSSEGRTLKLDVTCCDRGRYTQNPCSGYFESYGDSSPTIVV
jgi:hypothetical protein